MRINRGFVDIALAKSGLSSYAQLAGKMGCSAKNLSAILNRGTCRPATAGKIANALEVPVEDLVEAVNE